MHGMLSSAVILIAFALAAGTGGYTALWVYRATPGAPARSRRGRDDADVLEEDTGMPGEPEETGAGEPDGEAEPGEPDDPDDSPGARVYVLREPPV
ncbi:MAG TPA: hypothetical protein VGN41_13955 [Streptosporangiaceae bacterium]|jgi:hypothetical protein